jgi:hypothetical protein
MLPLFRALESLVSLLVYSSSSREYKLTALSPFFASILLQIEILSLSPRKNPSNGKTYGVNLQNGP